MNESREKGFFQKLKEIYCKCFFFFLMSYKIFALVIYYWPLITVKLS